MELLGSAAVRVEYTINPEGTLTLSGGASVGLEFAIHPSGGFVIDGSGTSTVYYAFNATSSWKVYGIVSSSQSFSWDNNGSNNAEPTVWWWKVTGECLPLTCQATGVENLDCDAKYYYTQVLTAYNIEDLCKRMKETFLTYPLLKWRVAKIERHSRPLRSTDDTQADKCQRLFEQTDFCTIPECLDFCLYAGVNSDSYVKMAVKATLEEVNQLPQSITPMVLSGSAEASLVLPPTFRARSLTRTIRPNGILTLTGSAVIGGNYGELMAKGAIEITVDSESVQSSGSGLTPMEWSSSTTPFVECVCTSPSILYCSHNFGGFSRFNEFALKNAKALPILDTLVYSAATGLWERSYHFHGYGLNNATNEQWLWKFEWSCTEIEAGQYTGQNAWKFDTTVRRLITRGQNKESSIFRITFNINDSKKVCSGKTLDLKINFDPITKLFSASKGVSVSGSYFDQIGVFSGNFWRMNPLKITISALEPKQTLAQMALTSFIPPTMPRTKFGFTPIRG